MKNTHMSQFIPPASIQKSAGTWTPTLATDLPGDVRTATAAAFNLFIPIPIPSNSEYRAGARLKSIDVFWKTATADFTSVTTVALKKVGLSANASAVTGTDVAVTVDTANDTTAERITQASHTMTVNLNTPAYLDDGDGYVLYITFDAAATTAFTLYGARANYEFKL